MTVSSRSFIDRLRSRNISYEDFLKLPAQSQLTFYCSRVRRTLTRLDSPINQYNPLRRVYVNSVKRKNYRLQKRELIILPQLVGKTILVYTGKLYESLRVVNYMVGKRAGMYVMSKKFPNHNKAKKKGEVKKSGS